MEEFDRVIHSDEIIEKTDARNLELAAAMIKIIGMCAIIEPSKRVALVKDDPSDNKIIECALEANADCIITYDHHLLELEKAENIKIVSPTEFIKSQK